MAEAGIAYIHIALALIGIIVAIGIALFVALLVVCARWLDKHPSSWWRS